MGPGATRPTWQNHSLAVYTAIIGQKPEVQPPDAPNAFPAPEGLAARLIHVPTWADVQRALRDPRLSPKVRIRLEPLLARTYQCWREARARLLRLGRAKDRARANGKSATSATHRSNSSSIS